MLHRATVLAMAVMISVVGFSTESQAFKVGQKAKPFRLKHSNGKWYTLKSFKKKVLLVWYEGAKSKEQNRWLKNKLLKVYDTNKIPQKFWESVGIANFQETAWPNAIIRVVIRKEQKKTRSPILWDNDGRMMKNWGFRNGRSNIYVLDKNRRLRWKTSGPISRKMGRRLVRLIRRLTKE